MKHILLLFIFFTLIGCSNNADKAAVLTKIITSCDTGATVSMEGYHGTWGGGVKVSCTWIKKAEQ